MDKDQQIKINSTYYLKNLIFEYTGINGEFKFNFSCYYLYRILYWIILL